MGIPVREAKSCEAAHLKEVHQTGVKYSRKRRIWQQQSHVGEVDGDSRAGRVVADVEFGAAMERGKHRRDALPQSATVSGRLQLRLANQSDPTK